MKFSDMRESKYLTQKDLPHPVRVTIDRWEMAPFDEDGGRKMKPICYFVGKSKAMVMNVSNQMVLEILFNTKDSDATLGRQIVIWANPNVMFKNERKGGLQVMDLQQSTQWLASKAQPQVPPTLSADPVAAVKAAGEFHVPDDSATAGAAQEPDGFLDGDTPYADDDSIPF